MTSNIVEMALRKGGLNLQKMTGMGGWKIFSWKEDSFERGTCCRKGDLYFYFSFSILLIFLASYIFGYNFSSLLSNWLSIYFFSCVCLLERVNSFANFCFNGHFRFLGKGDFQKGGDLLRKGGICYTIFQKWDRIQPLCHLCPRLQGKP